MDNLDCKAPIVACVAGSAGDGDVLHWAATEASATRRPLHIVHVDPTAPAQEAAGGTATTVLARSALRAHMAAPDLEVVTAAVTGAVVPALLRRAGDSALLVVGHHSGHGGRLAWSVSLAVATRAPCPVVVVRTRRPADPGEPPGLVAGTAAERVVVVSDGSEPSAAATSFAFRFAARRRIGLTVVRAWTPPFAGYPRMVLGLHQLVGAERRKLLADLSADLHEFPDVVVELTLVRDKHNHLGRVVIEESEDATLVVLGARGHSGIVGLLADPPCHAVLEHARCPVAVVKTGQDTSKIPVQPTAQQTAARSHSARTSSALPSEAGAKGRHHAGAAGRSAADEVTAVLHWLRSTQPTE